MAMDFSGANAPPFFAAKNAESIKCGRSLSQKVTIKITGVFFALLQELCYNTNYVFCKGGSGDQPRNFTLMCGFPRKLMREKKITLLEDRKNLLAALSIPVFMINELAGEWLRLPAYFSISKRALRSRFADLLYGSLSHH